MSTESVNQNKSFGASVISAAAFPVGEEVIHGIKSISRNRNLKNAMQSTNVEGFKTWQKNINGDFFSKSLNLADEYSDYSKLAATVKKLENRIESGNVSVVDRFLNIFRKTFAKDKVVTTDTLKERLKTANADLSAAQKALSATGSAAKAGLNKSIRSLFKESVKSKLVWFATALETLPEIQEKVIPAFKNEGFIAGIKQTGKTVLNIGANVLSYAAGSSVGKAIGAAIGTIICPGAGSAVGANIGSAIGITLGSIVKGKIFNKDFNLKEIFNKNSKTQLAQNRVHKTNIHTPYQQNNINFARKNFYA